MVQDDDSATEKCTVWDQIHTHRNKLDSKHVPSSWRYFWHAATGETARASTVVDGIDLLANGAVDGT